MWDRRTDQAVQGRVYFNPNDVGLKQVSHAEYVLTKKLEKGETVSVNITRLILEQMIEVQPPVYPGDMAYALFEVSTFGRLVGSTTFDTASDMKYIRIPTLYWKISGFDKERCRKIIAEKQESPVINYDEQKVIAEYRRRWKTK